MTFDNLDTVIAFAVVMLLLSLQVTVLVQMVVAISNLRGRNLGWGVARLLEQIDPNLKDHAKTLAEKVLTHPAIKHTRGAKATAIRSDELRNLLEDLADKGELPPGATDKLRLALGMDKEAVQRAQKMFDTLAAQFPKEAGELRELVKRGAQSVERFGSSLNRWFDTVMDRTSEHFVLWTRGITVVFAFVIAFVLHVDALQILRQISGNSELRARLVQSAEETVNKTEDMVTRLAETKPLATETLKKLIDQPQPNLQAVAKGLPDVPSAMATRAEGLRWLNTELEKLQAATSINEEHANNLRAAYESTFDEETKKWIGDLRDSAKGIQSDLQQTQLSIIPSPFPRTYSEYFGMYKSGRHWLGMMVTALSLSLGAPFWFNLLRQLSNLRPLLAGKVEKTQSGTSGPTA